MGLGLSFQRAEKKEKKKSAGERRRAATGAGHASTIGWNNAAPARCRHVLPSSRAKPQREPSRPNRTELVDLRVRGSRRACSLRLAPSRVRDHAFIARRWRVSEV